MYICWLMMMMMMIIMMMMMMMIVFLSSWNILMFTCRCEVGWEFNFGSTTTQAPCFIDREDPKRTT